MDVDANANILRVTINDACINAFNDFRMSRGKTKFIIFKISDNRREIVIDEISQDPDYEVFRSKLEAARDAKDNPGPRYAVYDVEYELGGVEGKRYGLPGKRGPDKIRAEQSYHRNKIIFISWVPADAATFVSPVPPSSFFPSAPPAWLVFIV